MEKRNEEMTRKEKLKRKDKEPEEEIEIRKSHEEEKEKKQRIVRKKKRGAPEEHNKEIVQDVEGEDKTKRYSDRRKEECVKRERETFRKKKSVWHKINLQI